jgi:phosphatidylglycerophosphate synthase
VANLISFIRLLLALVLCVALVHSNTNQYDVYVWLTLLIIWMDGWDGYVARLLKETSKAGAVIDILCDRVVEQAYWISFAVLQWVPLWMVLVIITRGVLVDGFRSLGLEAGYTAFGQTSMMQHPLGILFVSSRFSRWSYAVLKAAAFALLILAHHPNWVWLQPVADACVWGTLVFCILRGLPVLLESQRFLS